MKIRNQELVQLYGFFKEKIESAGVSFSDKRKMLKIYRALEDDFNLATQEERKVIEQFAERGEDGNIITAESGVRVSKENVVECSMRLAEIMTAEVEVDLDSFEHKFSEELFEGLKCSAETVALIEDNFIEE